MIPVVATEAERILSRMGIPKAYWEANADKLGDFEKNVVSHFVDSWTDKGHVWNGVFISGPRGCGKKYMAISLMKRLRVATAPFSGLFVKVSDLHWQYLKDNFSEDTTYRERVKSVSMLIIADVGYEEPKVTESFLDIVGHRAQEGLSTVVTTELGRTSFDIKYPDFRSISKGLLCPINMAANDFYKSNELSVKKDLGHIQVA